ncbi:LysR family transcriptional regulator [Hafnia paralvei]|uniref:LysR family transcriptional regulator n=1 Tax=Hafnia paralvei TaxID=546367 RepID=UPI0026733BB6|nr:LysR family transcriptional regulator [Hafnia paralvei]
MAERNERNSLSKIKVFDLNLLTIFEMVFIHSSVSNAAASLGMTPSAVSQSLQKLRNHFSDPLFIREGKGISPTTVAANLHEQLAQSMGQLNKAINPTPDMALKTKFVVYAPPFMSMALLPTVVRSLQMTEWIMKLCITALTPSVVVQKSYSIFAKPILFLVQALM